MERQIFTSESEKLLELLNLPVMNSAHPYFVQKRKNINDRLIPIQLHIYYKIIILNRIPSYSLPYYHSRGNPVFPLKSHQWIGGETVHDILKDKIPKLLNIYLTDFDHELPNLLRGCPHVETYHYIEATLFQDLQGNIYPTIRLHKYIYSTPAEILKSITVDCHHLIMNIDGDIFTDIHWYFSDHYKLNVLGQYEGYEWVNPLIIRSFASAAQDECTDVQQNARFIIFNQFDKLFHRNGYIHGLLDLQRAAEDIRLSETEIETIEEAKYKIRVFYNVYVNIKKRKPPSIKAIDGVYHHISFMQVIPQIFTILSAKFLPKFIRFKILADYCNVEISSFIGTVLI